MELFYFNSELLSIYVLRKLSYVSNYCKYKIIIFNESQFYKKYFVFNTISANI